MTTQTYSTELLREITAYAVDKMNDGIGVDQYGSDLHNELFNTDYFIIGRYDAEQFLTKNIGVFEAIRVIKDYNEMNFGEQDVDFSEPEIVVNMLAYIVGEEVLSNSATLQSKWDEQLTEEDIKQIINELNQN